MALAQKKISLDKCPHVSAQAKEALESASQPPIRLVTIGTGENRLQIGNETVMYRHEQKFHHPAGIGLTIEDTLSGAALDDRVAAINGLVFERVGQKIRPDLVCVKNSSGDREAFANAVNKVMAGTGMNLVLFAKDAGVLAEALKSAKDRRPLVVCGDMAGLEAFGKLAGENNVPLAVTCSTLEEAAQGVDTAKKAGVDEIVLNLRSRTLAKKIQDFTFARRAALKKNFRPLGYPVMAFIAAEDPAAELCEAVSCVLKYAGIVILKNTEKEHLLPILVARQDIYTDPQKPVQVEPKIYEIGKVTGDSPVLVTTNFSITYFTVAGEVEASKVPSCLIACDSEGMSVLTAWAAEKFTAESIADTLKKSGIENMVSHRKVVIPGYVSVLSGKLEELSGWKVSVGPREASGIPNYLKKV
jgi:acetyl-CoA decarbonylase/synthase complex subunit gamma